jgi:RNA polymerase-binding transcription factor DksA
MGCPKPGSTNRKDAAGKRLSDTKVPNGRIECDGGGICRVSGKPPFPALLSRPQAENCLKPCGTTSDRINCRSSAHGRLSVNWL